MAFFGMLALKEYVYISLTSHAVPYSFTLNLSKNAILALGFEFVSLSVHKVLLHTVQRHM